MAVYLGKNKVDMIGGQPVIIDGIDTSDATATSEDMAEGVTAYVDGEKITGNVQVLSIDLDCVNPYVYDWSDTEIAVRTDLNKNIMWRAGSKPRLVLHKSAFGTATAEDVAQGKTFTSIDGALVSGTASPGLVVKTGTITSTTINTGLSSVSYFVLYKTAVSSTGLIQAIYDGSTTNMTYCSAYSTSTWGTKTYAVGTASPTISGGTITWNISAAASGGLSASTTYNWIAFGTE